MKRFFAVVLCVIICAISFVSCAGNQSKDVALADVYASLEQVTNMPAMEIMPDALVETLFGFDLSKFEEYVFAEAADPSVNADTIILIRLNDSADMNDTCAVLDGYLASVRDNTQSYSPVNYAKAAKSSVTVIGSNCIYLVITTEYAEAEQVIINAFEN